MRLFTYFSKSKYSKRQPESIRLPYSYSGGTFVSEDSAMEVSAFYRGLIYISSQIAKLPWQIKDANNNVLHNHRTAKIIGLLPNEEVNSFMFRLFMTQSAIIFGNAYAEIERDTIGRVVALHPMRSRDVDGVRDSNGKLWYRVLGGSLAYDGEDALLSPNDVFHIRNLHTKDALFGQGLVGYASEVLGTAKGGDKFANSLYSNGGMPSGVLKVPGGLSDEAFDRLAEEWKRHHSGRKVGGTAILEDGTEYSPISFAPDVLQFLESRKFNVLELARFLGVPPTKLFDGESATFNNIEHANLEVATDTLDTWARAFEIEADIKLLNKRASGYRTEMDIYAIFRGDMATRSTYFKNMMQIGAMTPNQAREREGLSPYEGGDRYYIAVNNFSPADRVDDIIDSQVSNDAPEEKDTELDKAVLNYFKNKTNS